MQYNIHAEVTHVSIHNSTRIMDAPRNLYEVYEYIIRKVGPLAFQLQHEAGPMPMAGRETYISLEDTEKQ